MGGNKLAKKIRKCGVCSERSEVKKIRKKKIRKKIGKKITKKKK